MADTNQVTRSLMSAPLPLIIEQLGLSIAKAQSALDANSVKIAKELVETRVEIGGEEYSLLSLGFVPTFYAFTEATVEAKLSFSVSEETKTEIHAGLSVSVPAGPVLVAASVDVGFARKFSVSSEGQSSVAARIVSVPPPNRLNEVLIEAERNRPPAEPEPGPA